MIQRKRDANSLALGHYDVRINLCFGGTTNLESLAHFLRTSPCSGWILQIGNSLGQVQENVKDQILTFKTPTVRRLSKTLNVTSFTAIFVCQQHPHLFALVSTYACDERRDRPARPIIIKMTTMLVTS